MKSQVNAEKLKENPDLLKDVDLIFGGWGMICLDDYYLQCAPRLKAVFYGAGTVKGFVTDAFWKREIQLTSAYGANAIPVAEFTLAQIIFSLKRGWEHMLYKEKRDYVKLNVAGTYKSTVGLVSLGAIGSKVREYLRILDVEVLVYTGHPSPERAKALDVEFCSLEDLFQRSDVISLHTPVLESTIKMIDKKLLSMMKPNASLINTARGAVICEEELIDVLEERKDLYAILDVSDPEPPVGDSKLYKLPNVVLTPHIAGSLDKECGRMGAFMLEELERYLNGESLQWQVTKESVLNMA
jgi:phosphoglycerate dehydrogenase-like enzyme